MTTEKEPEEPGEEQLGEGHHDPGQVGFEVRERQGNQLVVAAVTAGGALLFVDKVNPSSSRSRSAYLKAMVKEVPGLGGKVPEGARVRLAGVCLKHDGVRGAGEVDADVEGGGIGSLAELSSEEINERIDAAIAGREATLDAHVAALDQKKKDAAIKLGQSPSLLSDQVDLIEQLGHVGERANSALLLLGYCTCRLRKPLHVLVKGSSSSGKSHLCEICSKILPPELVFHLTAMSEKFLAYLPEAALSGKVVILGERPLGDEEEVASRNKLMREMISQQFVTHGTVEGGRDSKNQGVLKLVLGPIASSETTTKIDIFDEDENRKIPIDVDQSDRQTRIVITHQAEALAGNVTQADPARIEASHNLIRMLKRPSHIRVPFAPLVGFSFPANRVEARRVHEQFGLLVQASALLHQMQREAVDENGDKVEWSARAHGSHTLLADPRDYVIAAALIQHSIGRALNKGLSPNDKLCLRRIEGWCAGVESGQKIGEFSTPEFRAMAREQTGKDMDSSNARKLLGRLVDFGALIQTQQGGDNRPNKYRLPDPEESAPGGGWALPASYEDLCGAYEAATHAEVPDHLSPAAFRDQDWWPQIADLASQWGSMAGVDLSADDDGEDEGEVEAGFGL